ncbi:S-methyl-5-thioribose kinase [Pseudalkalibacillus sp. SCS-8]|uniref:S-methyl-5-thioribose kinase n=1 Tax=Pseudalkalibacillus nanhaiensis TaxID=3115291 RepID=UPI0032DA89D2
MKASVTRFDDYFLLQPDDVIDYVKVKTDLFEQDEQLTCDEIGDGNLNYVFHVKSVEHPRSVIVKQAGHTARISDEFKLSTERIKIESEALGMGGKYAPGLVPKMFLYDDKMNCCIMEDLSDHTILREALLKHETFPRFADDITTYMVNTLLQTSDVVMNHKEKKELVKRYINPELCEISEDLVFTEPFNDYNRRNELFKPNEAWIKEEIYNDPTLHLEVAKLKFAFMTNAQALIHGDLHTGSVFVTKESTKVIDPEFAFYGPMGYDVGNVIANLIFAWANGKTAGEDDFVEWVEQTIVEVIELFKEKFLANWKQHATDPLAETEGFKEWYLRDVLADTAGITGMELARRIVGLAKVKDITSITDEEKRVWAERTCLLAAKSFIMKRTELGKGEDFLAILQKAAGSEQ